MESWHNEKILPQSRFGHIQTLGQMCGLTLQYAQSLVHNGKLDIPSLIHRFSDVGDCGDRLWQSFWQHALCLCMLAHFLLAPGFEGSSIRLIEVAQGLKEGKSCIGLTLAETLMGLNAFHRRETTKFVGSPLLLQRCPWFDLPEMSYNMAQQPGIQLISLTHCVFYFSFRFRRQFGHDQICPKEGIEYPTPFPIRGSQLARYPTTWRTRELLAPAPNFSCAFSVKCIAWLEDKAQTGPTLASEASTSSGRGCRNT
ncbi:hypothetical protein ACSBR2_040508 [Camellia fascicularis]